jgi:hypothetical protein
MAGKVLVASVLRLGPERPGSPVRWLVYWSMMAEQLGAQPGLTYPSRHEAEAAAMLWATQRMAPAPHVVSAR